jgi:hypothetical protein
MSRDTRSQCSEASNTIPKNEKYFKDLAIVAFRAMKPYILVGNYKLFGEICCSRPQDNILTKEATCPFETLFTTYRLHCYDTEE